MLQVYVYCNICSAYRNFLTTRLATAGDVSENDTFTHYFKLVLRINKSWAIGGWMGGGGAGHCVWLFGVYYHNTYRDEMC